MPSKYRQLGYGEKHTFDPDRMGISLACCDCGLVHAVNVIRHRKNRKVTIQLFRDEKATQERRIDMETTAEARITGFIADELVKEG